MIFVWPWNENARIKQKEQTNTNRVIWSAYQSDTNAHGFWLVKWTLWWKNFLSKNFLVSIDTSLWHHTATQLANQTMPSLYSILMMITTQIRYQTSSVWPPSLCMRFSEGGFESFFSGGGCIGTLWSLDISERYSLISEGGKKKWSPSGGEGEMCRYFWSISLRG